MLDDPQAPALRGSEGADIHFSGDSRYLDTSYSRSGKTGSRDNELVVWDVGTGELLVAEGPGFYWLPSMGSAPSGFVWSRNRMTFRFNPCDGGEDVGAVGVRGGPGVVRPERTDVRGHRLRGEGSWARGGCSSGPGPAMRARSRWTSTQTS